MRASYLFLLCGVLMMASGCAVGPAGISAAPSPTQTQEIQNLAPELTPTLTTVQVIEAVLPSIVRVQAQDSEGTGFVVYQMGQVITAFHVVGNADSLLTVVASDNTEHRAMVLGADQERDVALLSVPTFKALPLPLGSMAGLGETVYAIGYAAGFVGDASITQGIVSANRMDGEAGITYVQTDASLNPGNSGGPLLNERGEVIGVNVVKLRGVLAEYEGLGFALSAEELIRAQVLLQSGTVRLLPTPIPLPTPSQPPTRVPTVTRTPVPVPTATPLPIREWCAFRQKVEEFGNANNAWSTRWANYIKRQPTMGNDARAYAEQLLQWMTERSVYANEMAEIHEMACSLPRSLPAAKPIADKLCASIDSMLVYLRSGGGAELDYLRVRANQFNREAYDLLAETDRLYGYPQCR